MTALAAKLDNSSWIIQAMAVLIGTCLITAGAWINVPMLPVPMTMQSLAVLLIAGTYGMRMASVTTAAYIAQGAVGLPIFAGGSGGPAHLVGPTGGYLMGFVACAIIVSALYENGFNKGVVKPLISLSAGSIALMVCGVAYLATFTGLEDAIASGLAPFALGMVVKVLLAFALIKGTQKIFRA
jgi:biotin transport system substrate-specific component